MADANEKDPGGDAAADIDSGWDSASAEKSADPKIDTKAEPAPPIADPPENKPVQEPEEKLAKSPEPETTHEPEAPPEIPAARASSPSVPPPPSSDPALSPVPPTPAPLLERLLAHKKVLAAAGAAVALLAIGIGVFAATRSRNPESTGATLADAAPSAVVTSADTVPLDAAVAIAVDAGPPAPPPPPAYRIREMKSDKTVEYVEGKIGKRPFVSAMTHAPLARNEVARIMKAFADVHTFERCQPNDSYALAKDRATGRVLAFEYWSQPDEVFQAREDAGALVGKRIQLYVSHTRKAAGFVVKDDLKKSLAEAGFQEDVLKLLDEAFEGHLELKDVRPGDKLRIIANEERIDDDPPRTSELVAIEYVSEKANAEPLRVYHYERAHDSEKHAHDKRGGFWDAKGQRPFRGGFRSPIPFARITSRYNPRRMHPVLHVVMPHNGIDFAASTGTPVYAAAAGVVVTAGDSGPCGNMVQIDHPGGITTSYCHLSKFAPGIHPGVRVDTRQLVGFSGQTGRVTGPHLHFAAKKGDNFIDPQGLRLDGVRVIPPQDRDPFQAARIGIDKELDAIAFPGAPAPRAPAKDDDGGADDDEIMDSLDVPDAH